MIHGSLAHEGTYEGTGKCEEANNILRWARRSLVFDRLQFWWCQCDLFLLVSNARTRTLPRTWSLKLEDSWGLGAHKEGWNFDSDEPREAGAGEIHWQERSLVISITTVVSLKPFPRLVYFRHAWPTWDDYISSCVDNVSINRQSFLVV